MSAIDGFTITPKPAVHFGVGAIGQLPGVVRATGADRVVVVTDATLAMTPVIATVMAMLAEASLPVRLFTGVHPNPTTDDLAAGTEAVAEAAAAAAASAEAAAVTATLKASVSPAPSAPFAPADARIALVAVGGGSPIDAAKGIAVAAVNPQRGRDLDYRGDFAGPALPIVAVPTTAGTGAETNAFGVVTDPVAHGVALAMLLPDVLRFNLPVRTERMADVAFALGIGDTHADAGRNAGAAIEAIGALREQVGLTALMADFGITEADFAQIAADALDDEMLANAPRQPTKDDIGAILLASAGLEGPG